MTPFDAAVERFREAPGGEVSISDYFPHRGRPPYRSAQLLVRVSRADSPHVYQARVSELAAELAVLATEVGAYLTMNVHDESIHIRLMVTRDLDEDEIGDQPCATREVEP